MAAPGLITKKTRFFALRLRPFQILSARESVSVGGAARELHWFAALKELAVGVLISLCIIVSNVLFLHTTIGEAIQKKTFGIENRVYQAVQDLFGEVGSSISVVDISKLKPDGRGVTPRDPLINLVNAIAEQRPRAIGVDIDFSRDGDRLADPEDIKALSSFLHAKAPTFVGVHRALGRNPSSWFLLPEYTKLGAALLIPSDTRLYVRDLGSRDQLSMVLKLAQTRDPGWLPCPFCEHPHDPQIAGTNEAYANLKGLDEFRVLTPTKEQFRDQALIATYMAESSDLLRGKFVLIGDVAEVANREDSFETPDRSGPTPGVLLQAAGLYTALMKPRLVVNERSDLIVDTTAELFCVLVLVGTVLIRSDPHELERFRIWLSCAFGFLILMGALIFNLNGVLFESCFVVAAVQFLRAFVEGFGLGALRRLGQMALTKRTNHSVQDGL